MANSQNQDYRIAEAIIFASEKAISIKDIKKKLPHVRDLKKILLDLQKQYEKKGINLKVSDNCWYFETASDLLIGLSTIPFSASAEYFASVKILIIIFPSL